MSELPEVIDLGPRDEAESLWSRARAARDGAASGDLVSLLEALDLGLRAMEILVIERLEPVKDRFPATIAIQLDRPRPEVDPVEDAITVPNSLQFSEIVDILSREELDCVAPGLHRGWEDRRFSCRRSRATAQEALEVALEEEEQSDLLLLSAYRNRIFRAPPPVRVIPKDILEAFKSLEKLAEDLF
jgi:hypothetical protein